MSATVLTATAVGCGIAAVAAYYVVRLMRGSITLFLPHRAFNPGDSITGSFDLHTKKPIQGNKLTVSLIGVQVTEVYKRGKTETDSQEIYRDERIIEAARLYNAGYRATHEFSLAVPGTTAPELMNSALGQVLDAASRLFSNRSTRLTWKVEARLDAKGVDLAASVPVSINNIPPA